LKREEKEKNIEEMREITQKAHLLVLADYRGMNVSEIVTLRREVRKAGGGLKVVKNTLFQRALQGTDFENLNSLVDGPTAALFHKGDPIPVIRILNNWVKSQPKFKVKAGGLVSRPGQAGRVLNLKELQAIANLPSRQVLLGNLVAQLSSPLIKFNYILKSRIWNLLGVLEAVKREKEKETAKGN